MGCSKTCKTEHTPDACARPGCGKPTFNGQPGEYCSRRCKRAEPAAEPAAEPGAEPAADPDAAPVHEEWKLVEITDTDTFNVFQRMLDSSHTKRYTTDRGCLLHG